MVRNSLQLSLGVFVASSALIVGCNRPAFTVAPVHGMIMIDGQPLKEGKVMFAPIAQGEQRNPGKPAIGKIGSDGSYRLTTFSKDDGAVIGEHWATIFKVGDLPEGVPDFDRFTSPTKVAVVAGKDNEIDVKLTRDIVKKYAGNNR